ncbi:LysR family transcriptional regulator [uncultured Cohaesibacter sp.]|uniref:helix-turn-helix domain-containing protein n=1 Tax=uncultured Cohaesibacter sp. TaxID=1002546 RepID=UPI0029C9177A|nr:LysR family transcriptional regulator [uncultured Cohaesibacter sp.]
MPFGEGDVPISMSELETRTEGLMALDDRLDEPLKDWCKLRLSPKLIFRFIAVYEQGSINSAAEALGIAQPQLSRQIAYIEEILGARLFEREHRGPPTLALCRDLLCGRRGTPTPFASAISGAETSSSCARSSR